jgi:site-specific DNA-methyltransferase (adenine-specific)
MMNAKGAAYYTEQDDGLRMSWYGNYDGSKDVIWMNPPYGREIGKWMKKAADAAEHGCTVVCLVPARTDTRWWHDYAIQHEVRFIKGRLKFGGSKNSAPFPSAVVMTRQGTYHNALDDAKSQALHLIEIVKVAGVSL